MKTGGGGVITRPLASVSAWIGERALQTHYGRGLGGPACGLNDSLDGLRVAPLPTLQETMTLAEVDCPTCRWIIEMVVDG